ncbi:MAG TPA: phospholipase D-like domain-containing protein [Ignavibacteria bacterium]|nr:phospholipase D-like domain-containing protein [Ignavibacteria bacterium]
MKDEFQVSGTNSAALFTMKLHRGDGMSLIAMNWKKDKPPKDFVGFAIEYKEPKGNKFYLLKNRLSFPGIDLKKEPKMSPTRFSPIQKFRWVHFPRNAELAGEFTYRVTPVFMNELDELSYGEHQEASIELRRETYPMKLNVAYTRGFVASQAFVDRYNEAGAIKTLLPAKAKDGLKFKPTHPKAKEALAWMGFEARHAILEVLDLAIADKKAQVRVIAYDLSEPDVVSRLKKLGSRLKIIIDDKAEHGEKKSGETQSEKRLLASAGKNNVIRQHMGNLQHNKTIVVNGPKVNRVVCGSTNFTWRGFFVQSNNALILQGKNAVKPYMTAFDDFWNNNTAAKFGKTGSAKWNDLGFENIKARVSFSPHSQSNALLESIAGDLENGTKSCLLYSLAFLHITPGAVKDAIKKLTKNKNIFVYGIADKKVGGIVLQKPDGNVAPVYPSALTKGTVPEPFKSEPTGGGGNRMHHKFLVIDFDKPSARVYTGSYNFSNPADRKNGENLLLINDRRIAVSYMIEALRIFDHYHFRVTQQEAKTARKKLELSKPPRKAGEKPWWEEDFTNAHKIKDRILFA